MPAERTYRVQYLPSAWKEITRLPDHLQYLLFSLAESLEWEPCPSGCKKLQGQKSIYRFRSGYFRVVYEIQDSILLVTVVSGGNRKDIYR